jgi:putative hydrolase of the HAD superfamily
MVQAILFDFGNVLGFFDHRRATRKLVAFTDLTEADLFVRLYDSALEDAFEAGRIEGPGFLREARARTGFRGTDDEFTDAFADIFTPNAEVCDLIPRLAGRYRLVLASNTNVLHAGNFLRSFADTLRHFQGIGLSYEAGARKPHPDFYAHCQRLAGVPKEECLFIDDIRLNVEGAEAFGFRAVQYTTTPNLLGRLRSVGIDV